MRPCRPSANAAGGRMGSRGAREVAGSPSFPPATGTVTLLQLPSSNLKRCHTASDAASCFAYTDPCASRPAAEETTTSFLTGETPGPNRSNDLTKVTMAGENRSGYRPRVGSLRSPLGPRGSRSPPGFGGAVATHPVSVVHPPPS